MLRFRLRPASLNILCRSLFGGPKQGKKESQSKVLGDVSSQVYELQVHDVKPECMQDYLQRTEESFQDLKSMKDLQVQLTGSWTTDVGSNLDQAVHIFKYKGGYKSIDQAKTALQQREDWKKYQSDVKQLVNSRSSQILVAFTFWDPTALEEKSQRGLYELRSYTLKPGALIEWGQLWKQGIKFRQKEEAVGGWFSQIGVMHVVHHLWVYCDYVHRHETRQAAWELPGWDECVLRTVPLVRHMETRILRPTPFSPLQ